MQDFVNILSNFGFPVTIACYLLFRFEKILEKLTIKNEDLSDNIVDLKNEIKDLKDEIKCLRERRK
jgi:cell division protein FtsB